jgi:hypothetical protein
LVDRHHPVVPYLHSGLQKVARNERKIASNVEYKSDILIDLED